MAAGPAPLYCAGVSFTISHPGMYLLMSKSVFMINTYRGTPITRVNTFIFPFTHLKAALRLVI